MTRELQDEGLKVGRRRTARLMRENGLKARQKQRFKRTTDSHHAFPIAPNLLEQNFSAEPCAQDQIPAPSGARPSVVRCRLSVRYGLPSSRLIR